ncbi:MAG TPA: hypothetical protein VMX76_01140 [Nevskiaceae bacterium]|nr:hypothetical protein [Nevskiaceae bacterium]
MTKTNLTQIAYYARRALKIGTIFLIAFLIVRGAVKTGLKIWRAANPPLPPKPTMAFGKLPKIKFPDSTIKTSELSFKLETIEGALPEFPESIKVYFIPQKAANLLASSRAKDKAYKMGFKNEPEIISETVYHWTSQSAPPTILKMNIVTGNFDLRYDFRNDPEILTSKNLPTTQQTAQEAKGFLVSGDFLPEDLANGTAEFEYLFFEPPELKPVLSFSEANFIRVNLFHGNLNDLKILPPNPKKSLISFLFSSSRTTGKRIVEIDYTYFPIEKEILATYPLKPASLAWEELQNDGGYIAHLRQNEKGPIIIRKVLLAYYDSQEPQYYLQPIYVFEGDREFFAYVPAIDSKWMEQD